MVTTKYREPMTLRLPYLGTQVPSYLVRHYGSLYRKFASRSTVNVINLPDTQIQFPTVATEYKLDM